ncbi:MAG: NADPH-dependent reductase [Microbacteriaceae bacterium]|jgi:NAD(P)H-dependent FMN reductase|nr:NADPH-dependent reductase [Microbacteriaceae bacterium]
MDSKPRLMIIIGSVRPGRVGLPIANWAFERASATSLFDIEMADLADIDLPFLNEPAHPRLAQYSLPHTVEWSERVAAADAFLLVAPEYNYGYAPALKNALDFLNGEWRLKPVAFVSYGGISAGTRGAAALAPVLMSLGLVRAANNVEIPFARTRVEGERFFADERLEAVLLDELHELALLAVGMTALRRHMTA